PPRLRRSGEASERRWVCPTGGCASSHSRLPVVQGASGPPGGPSKMICSGGHMKGRLLFLASVMIPTLVAASGPGPFSYPAAPKSDTAEDHFGHRILDPYRPLEDANSDAPKAWVG